MPATTSLRLFHARRDAFERELDGAQTLEDASHLLVRQLRDLERVFTDGLAPADARLVGFHFEALRAVVPIVTAATSVEVAVAASPAPDDRSAALLLTLLTTALAGLLFVSLLSVAAVPALLALILLRLVSRDFVQALRVRMHEVALLGPALKWMIGSRRATVDAPSAGMASPPTVTIRAASLIALRFVRDALDVVDRAVRAQDESAERTESRTPLEDAPDVLDLLQELLGSAQLGDAGNTVKTAQTLVPQVLRAYGLSASAPLNTTEGVRFGK